MGVGMNELAAYLALGACTGVLAGLLGVGGGIVIVPMLVWIFSALPWGEAQAASIAHLALGTSLASIVFTSISSVRAHHQRGAVDWGLVKRLSPALLVGTLAGTWVASQMSTPLLKAVFIVFAFYVGLQMLFNLKPSAGRDLPGTWGLSGVGAGIGVFSSLVGIGGGSVSVPFMSWCRVPLHRAIATSAALGFPIAVAGATGYILNGLHLVEQQGPQALPAPHLGYVYLPALAGVALGSVLTAPFGAKLAHALPVARLKQCFAVLLLLLGSRMLWSMLR
ncbi:sulfite exporter TauE/SafE family protein [Paucibacter sp. Y2R2-4]|uniref:sulfite exporter TauE/SafE family protein n=1 Tax=Paucibacter sp. Y2R2-4 TaxID=2893553 RepID=UPI0021E4FEC0|nr:sulfite exporter TauE/SafE family protein [Paucibacter sp. Y2R2-4]MCV2350246.1 sulfite exporter TauE/SafE family protein [Paucibacter sp. Y2R2-4]